MDHANKMDIIVATDSKFGIARGGRMPWTGTRAGAEDLAYFRTVTGCDRIIMGRRTWESLPRWPLPGRKNTVLSTDRSMWGQIIENGATDCIDSIESINAGWIIGGAAVYSAAIATGRVRRIFLTFIDRDYECDTHFPIAALFAGHSTRLESCNRLEYDGLGVYRMVLAVSRDWPDGGELGYLRLLRDIAVDGESRDTRNARTRSLFARSLSFDLGRFPLLTTKTVFLRGVFEELMMFIRGETNTRVLSDRGVRIWEPNTSAAFLAAQGLPYTEGEMGPMYGYNWRHFGREWGGEGGVDQFAQCLDLIARDPASRRIIMTTYNPAVAHLGVLYPCHGISVQFHVSVARRLSCAMTQRSGDAFLGVPFNIASYALLVYIMCSWLNSKHRWDEDMCLRPGRLTINFGDVHLYESHVNSAYLQLLRSPGHPMPELEICADHDRIEDYVWSDVRLTGYVSAGKITADMIA